MRQCDVILGYIDKMYLILTLKQQMTRVQSDNGMFGVLMSAFFIGSFVVTMVEH